MSTEQNTTNTILLYGGIGEWDYSDERGWHQINTAADIRQQLDEIGQNHDLVHLRINSPGGLLSEGIAIVNTILQSKVPVEVYIDGIAASAAAVIALTGRKVYAATNALLMFHNCSGWAWGNAKELRETAKACDAFDASMATTIAERTGMSAEEIQSEILNYTDNWFTAAQALEKGLIDETIGMQSEGVPTDPTAMGHQALVAWYQSRQPHGDGAGAAPKPKASKRLFRNPFTPESKSTTNDIMTMEALKAAINDGTLQLSADSKAKLLAEIEAGAKQEADLKAALSARDQAIQANTDLMTALEVGEGEDALEKIQALKAAANDVAGAQETTETPASSETPEDQDDPVAAFEAKTAKDNQAIADQFNL